MLLHMVNQASDERASDRDVAAHNDVMKLLRTIGNGYGGSVS